MQIETSITPLRCVFENEEGFRIYGVVISKGFPQIIEYNKYGNFTITGNNIPELKQGIDYKVVLEKDERSKYKDSYRLVKFGEVSLDSVEEQWGYLKSMATELQYENILNIYDPKKDMVIDMIRNDEFDYEKIKGMGESLFRSLKNKIEENIDIAKGLAFFTQYGVTANSVDKMIKNYGSAEKAIETIKENPYLLITISGFGFIKVDEIALKMGIEKNSKFRIETCLEYIIKEESNNGHTWIGKKGIIDKSISLLDIEKEDIEEVLNGKLESIIKVDERYTLKSLYETENYIAYEIIARNLVMRDKENTISDFVIDEFEKKNNLKMSDEQKQMIHDFEKSSVSFLIGNAGSGKSLLTRVIIEYAKIKDESVLLLAPTGRASKVLRNYTGKPAFTIHKRLVTQQPIHEDIIIVDESSMCDIYLIKNLLESIANPKAKVVFVGDDAQIPSVGAGNFLYDCINSGVVRVNKLTQVFRQKEGGILDIATKTRNGEKFINSGYTGRRVFGKNCVLNASFKDTKVNILEAYKNLYKSKKWALEDIVILTPTNKGKLGTYAINQEIQKIVNPPSQMKNEKSFGKTIFREGDLVMNITNRYKIKPYIDHTDINQILEMSSEEVEIDIFNGESGIIKIVNNDEKYLVVNINEQLIKYDFSEVMSYLTHGWAITIHKCITDDTWIYTDKGLMQLKEFNNGANVGESKKINEKIKVFNGTYLEQPLSFYNNGMDTVKNIVTSQGYSIKATKEHGLDVYRNNDIIRVNAEDVLKGDKLVLSVGSNKYGKNKKLPKEWLNRSKIDTRAILYNRPDSMTKEFARFLGYMVADGTVAKNAIKFSKRNREVAEDFANIVYSLFGYKTKITLRKSGDYMCEVCSVDIVDFCKNIEGLQPHDKYVPKAILESPKVFQQQFLKTVFEDGSVHLNKRNEEHVFDHIEMSSKNPKLIKQIQMMLLNMGMISSYRERKHYDKKYKKERTIHALYLYKYESRKFLQQIGFVSHYKNKNLEKCMVEKNQRYNTSKNKYLEHEIFGMVYLDEVVEIVESEEETYCLEIPETHKFVQNGFHAYNCQGSQYKVVLAIVDSSSTFQLNANLLYTGFSRATDYMLISGQAKAINIALQKFANLERRSFTRELLQEKALQMTKNMV